MSITLEKLINNAKMLFQVDINLCKKVINYKCVRRFQSLPIKMLVKSLAHKTKFKNFAFIKRIIATNNKATTKVLTRAQCSHNRPKHHEVYFLRITPLYTSTCVELGPNTFSNYEISKVIK